MRSGINDVLHLKQLPEKAFPLLPKSKKTAREMIREKSIVE